MTGRSTFLLVKPDIPIRGLLEPFLQDLLGRGLCVRKFLIGRCGSRSLRTAYGGTKFKWQFDDWELNTKVYQFGPALGLIVEGVGHTTTTSAHDVLCASKGAALPRDWTHGTLRASFGVNRVFNAVHVPDTAIQANEEAALWFGLRGPWLHRAGSGSSISAADITKAFTSQGYFAATCDGFIVFCYLQLRLLHAISNKATAVSESGPEISSIARCIQQAVAAAKTTTADALDRISALYRDVIDECAKKSGGSIVSDCVSILALELLQKLTASVSALGEGLPALWFVCDELDVYYSPLERYCLEVHQRYLSTL